ncbi:hypothetical protein CGC56_10250 [Capnocytophaga canimorsus]|uniref:Uncharacterized protein n=2 Tax=Capnocytophaga canimorsus TaxID=28188 RepID=A0A250G6W8_9FLAO|nr:hypothetical protein [Capnocytophaga canimorsus]ATA92505.1 hypothetical protein CGC56_10250 [Capnocytophaga canimorsus]AWL79352.1 hypothetical protein DKB58_10605 [Capnocytophaga canimorsus]AYW35927.1 hypothetical protein D8L92_00285 [Capnocytophaga canimorsus]
MNIKTKAFLLNFICFVVIFIGLRMGIHYLFPIKYLYAAIISGIVSLLIAPRFAVVNTAYGDKLLMKWIFIKGVKEL